MKLYELRDKNLEYLKSKFPKMPEYVVQDLVYQGYRDNPGLLDDPQERKDWVDDFVKMDWKLEELKVTLDIFDDDTKKRLTQRAGGKPAVTHVAPKDKQRHQTQKQLIQKGPSQEPIIVISGPNGYDLIEGWHRTIQSLEQWPDGYKQIAWVAYE